MLLSLIVGFAAFFVLKDALDVTTGQGWLLWLVCVPVFVGLVTKFLTKPVEPVLEAAIAKLKPLSPHRRGPRLGSPDAARREDVATGPAPHPRGRGRHRALRRRASPSTTSASPSRRGRSSG